MKILVLNCGSSSVKFQLIETDVDLIKSSQENMLVRGSIERIGVPPAVFHYQPLDINPLDLQEKKDSLPSGVKKQLDLTDHTAAIKYILDALCDDELGVVSSPKEIDAVGHRVVHGGELFKKPALIDDQVLEGIQSCSEFAPLHNPHNINGYLSSKDVLSHCPHVAVFDTAFHQSMPEHAYLYALPYEIYKEKGIRRYGFHGTSHRYVTYRVESLTKVPREEFSNITVHLGNGCSISAVKGGLSMDTSMGFTPLEGLVMGTRTGDVDPQILLNLMDQHGMSFKDVNTLVNKQSGLLGISGVSSDMRQVQEAADQGNERAQLAVAIFAYRIKKYIGSYAAVLSGPDHIMFTGGIGENSSLIRKLCVEGLEFMGIKLDEAKNEACHGKEGIVSAEDSNTKIWVIPTNEELVLARDTARCLASMSLSSS